MGEEWKGVWFSGNPNWSYNMDENCRKTKTRAIIPANHDRIKQLDEPIRIPAITVNVHV